MIRFDAQPIALEAAQGEETPRTISGVAVPWDKPATVMSGEKVMFQRGAFDVTARPKLLEGHDMGQLRGVVTELADTESGLQFTAKFANTRASNDAIALVKLGAYDSVSVGAQPTKYKYDKNGVMVVEAADIVEISLVAMPAFKDAVITEIAASEPDEAQPDTNEGEPEVSDATPVVEASEPTIPTQPLLVAAAPAKPFQMPSVGEYISKFVRGGSEFAEFLGRIKAAAPDVTTSETPGLLPELIVGPVYNGLVGRRPLIDAIGSRAMPQAGKVFLRPYVDVHTTIGASNGENSALDAGVFEVKSEQVTKGVYGGYVRLSEEDMDWSDPSVINLLIDDMARVYAAQTEEVVETAFESGISATQPLTDSADPKDWATFVWQASKDILDNSTHLPTHMFLSPDYWAALGQLVDQQDRPLFPQVGPMNAFGNVAPGTLSANAFGLTVVVCPHASGFAAVGNPDGFEIYEQQKGAISVEAADGSLSRYIKFRGYLATLMIDETKFVKQGAGA